MKKKAKQKPKFIISHERAKAAIYFTLSNLAMLDWIKRAGNNFDVAFHQANDDMQMDAGASIRPELNDWVKMINAGDAYCFEEWEKARVNYLQDLLPKLK